MKKLLALLLLLALASPVWASEGGGGHGGGEKKAEGGEHGGDSKKGPKDVTGGRFAGDPIYVRLEPMILPLITSNGAQQIITMQITVEIKDFNAADDLHNNIPRVRDALMRALYGNLGNGTLRQGELVDVTKVKARARQALGEVLGSENVRDVLIEAVAQRRL